MQVPSRRLGATEQAVWLRDRITPLHFALAAQIEGTIDPQLLRNALDRLQQHHPLLRVKIALKQGVPYFVEQSALIPCRAIPRLGETHWQAEAARELAQPFNWTEPPLIRVVLLSAPTISELIVVCHHAIADGIATVNLIREILSLLENSDQVLSTRLVPPCLESSLPKYQPASTLQKLLVTGVVRLQEFRRPMRRQMNFTKEPLSPRSSFQIEAGNLSPETTTQLINRCRQEGTTVHAALCTAWLFAIALNHPAQQVFRCFSPINLRPYLKPLPEQECGIYIAPARTTHAIAPQTQFWETARSLKAGLIADIDANYLLKLAQRHELLMSANPSPALVQQIFTENCASDVMVTNLGRLAIPQHDSNLCLKAIYGPMVRSGFEPERVCGVATLGDRLCFTFLHSGSDAESGLAKNMTQLLKLAVTRREITLKSVEPDLTQSLAADLLLH